MWLQECRHGSQQATERQGQQIQVAEAEHNAMQQSPEVMWAPQKSQKCGLPAFMCVQLLPLEDLLPCHLVHCCKQ